VTQKIREGQETEIKESQQLEAKVHAIDEKRQNFEK